MNAKIGTRNAEPMDHAPPPRDLKDRTRAFAVEIVRLVQDLPRGRVADVIEEETDESAFWLDLMVDGRLATTTRVIALRREAGQLVAITVASIRTARGGRVSVPRSAFRVPRST